MANHSSRGFASTSICIVYHGANLTLARNSLSPSLWSLCVVGLAQLMHGKMVVCIVSFIQLFCSSKYRHSAQPHQFMRFLGFTFIINTQSQTTTRKSISPKGIFENRQTHCTICHQTETVCSKCDWNLNVYESGFWQC